MEGSCGVLVLVVIDFYPDFIEVAGFYLAFSDVCVCAYVCAVAGAVAHRGCPVCC